MPAPKLRQILAAGEFVVAPGVFELEIVHHDFGHENRPVDSVGVGA